ncbi:hypothetical protein ACXHJ2_21025 [Paenibacillus sp. ALE3]
MTVFPWYIDSLEMKETDDGLANVPVLFCCSLPNHMARAGGMAPVNQRKHEQSDQNPCAVQFRSVSPFYLLIPITLLTIYTE